MTKYHEYSDKELQEATLFYINEWVNLCRVSHRLFSSSLLSTKIMDNDTIIDMKDSIQDALDESETAMSNTESQLKEIFTLFCKERNADILEFVLPPVFDGNEQVYREFFADMDEKICNTDPYDTKENNCKLFLNTAKAVIKDNLEEWNSQIPAKNNHK